MQKRSLSAFAQKSNCLYCYGIGNWGNNVTKYCKKHQISITAYLVSDEKYTDKNFCGKPVIVFKKGVVKENDGIIIATVKMEYRNTMMQGILKYSACKNLYFLDENKDFSHYFMKLYNKQVEKRVRSNPFDYLRLAQPIDLLKTCQWDESNIYYGQNRCVKKYVKVSPYDTKKCTIDHGVRLMLLSKTSELMPRDKNLYTMGDFVWRNILGVNVHTLGPYIQYAKSIISYGKLRCLKKSFGKTMLVFPVHSIYGVDVEYNYQLFIAEIEKIKKQYHYQTVLVCVFCTDILKRQYIPYKKMGYKIITAGYTLDYNFLRRLRSFILLSDMVITNAHGTHIGYSICLNTPVYIFNMDIVESNVREISIKEGYTGCWDEEEHKGMVREREIKECFYTYREFITEKQYEVIEKYWGRWNRRHQIRKV